MTPTLTRVVLVLLALATTACGEPRSAVGPITWGPAWTVRGNVAKGKDLSGAAAFAVDRALVVSDETRAAQRVSFDTPARTMTVHEELPLLPGKGAELDLEGAAASVGQGAYFLVGSQALSRNRGAFEADRGYVFKLPVDSTGRPQTGAVAKANLRPVLTADAELSPFLDKPAEENGLDIEGLAERGGRLFFGLRAPVRDGQATVVEVGVDDLFAGQARSTLHRLAFGPGRGIRDLAALQGDTGFLVLVGPSGGPDSRRSPDGAGFELWHWPGPGSAAAAIGALGAVPGEPDAKAETVLVLNQNETAVDGLILHDGPKNGAPHGFRLSLPKAP